MKTPLAFALTLLVSAVAAASPSTETVARGLVQPWALAFLPDGRMLVTEKPGRLRVIGPDGRPGEPIAGLPEVDAGGQCGLLDVVVDPKHAENRLIYWTYAEAGDGGNGVAVARGRLDDGRLNDVQVIFRQAPIKRKIRKII